MARRCPKKGTLVICHQRFWTMLQESRELVRWWLSEMGEHFASCDFLKASGRAFSGGVVCFAKATGRGFSELAQFVDL